MLRIFIAVENESVSGVLFPTDEPARIPRPWKTAEKYAESWRRLPANWPILSGVGDHVIDPNHLGRRSFTPIALSGYGCDLEESVFVIVTFLTLISYLIVEVILVSTLIILVLIRRAPRFLEIPIYLLTGRRYTLGGRV